MRFRLIATVLCIACRPAASQPAQPDPSPFQMKADILIINAVVHTMSRELPVASSIATFGNRIAAIGTNAEIRNLAGNRTRVIDARGRLVLPGFNDAHVHFLSGGFQLSSVDLREADTQEEFARRLRRFVEERPTDLWVTGGDWDHERWPTNSLPTRQLIDNFTKDTPVFVSRLDGHMALANTKALALAGIRRDTPNPEGGLIIRDPKSGEPTGLLKDSAMNLVHRVIPPATFDGKLAAARAATEHAARLGVTSVQDMSAGPDVGVYQTLLHRGELKTRIYAVWPLPKWKQLAATGIREAFGHDMLRTGGLKGFSDGSLGSTTALFFDPYLDAPETHGLATDEMFPDGAMLERVTRADAAGLQVMVHAIGDKANDTMLTLFQKVAGINGHRDRRFRIEHAQHLRPGDATRFASEGIIASMQPYHVADDGRWAEKRIGAIRCKNTYAFKSLIDAGVTLAFGSDWTVAPLDPIQGIAAAVTRETLDGKHPAGWIPEQRISVHEAVRAYTVGSAFAEHTDHHKGQLKPGFLADLVILDRDVFSIEPREIGKTSVILTIMDGRIVFESPAL